MFVGYADDHAGDLYRFINIQANSKTVEPILETLPNERQQPKKTRSGTFLG